MDRPPRRTGPPVRASALGFLTTALAGCLLGCPTDPAPSAPPNVVLIVVDTLRADHLSHYGYARETAAPLDDFRASATLYRHAFATAPWTGPSTMSILTGLSASRHGRHEYGDTLPDEARTLAEILDEAGYTTHGISFNYVVSEAAGFAQGFDRFDDYLGPVNDYPDVSAMVRGVGRWVDEGPREPFFLYLQPMSVHGPYRVPRSRQSTLLGHPPSESFEYWGKDLMKPLMFHGEVELREKVTPEMVASLVDRYDVAVRYSMEELAKIMARLEAAGLLENTLVVLTADHGEELFDHGGFTHGYTLHREVLHVPLYVHLPGQTKPGTVDHAVSIVDILPTIVGAVGLDVPRDVDGYDLNAVDPSVHEGRLLVQQVGWKDRAEGRSAIRGQDHWIEMEHSYDSPKPRRSLFDLVRDPGEKQDLTGSRPADASRLRASLADEVERLAKGGRLPAPVNVMEQMDQERLRALGYVE